MAQRANPSAIGSASRRNARFPLRPSALAFALRLMGGILNPTQAEEHGFQGSPTILVDGRDIWTGEIPSGFNYTCRVYSFEGESTGVIPRDFIRARLIEWGETLDR